jgi:hypothetical protein
MRREQRGTGEDGERQRPLQAPQPGYSEGTALAVTAEVSVISGPVAARRDTAGHLGGAARRPFPKASPARVKPGNSGAGDTLINYMP